ncbi:MAG: hypothetical protein EOO89_00735 [Pedobacter sp.]|nr:MAG: hypothetical protein EOO89_00735 [Pedobacter sp.]
MLLVKTFTCICMLTIFIEDLKYRAVHWWLFPLLLASCWYMASEHDLQQPINNLLWNTIFLASQFLLLTIYFSLKRGQLTSVFKGLFGIGDLFFLLSIAVYFSFLNYLLFYVASLLLIVCFELFWRINAKNQERQVPLAGYQSLLMVILLFLEEMNLGVYASTDDRWLISYFF